MTELTRQDPILFYAEIPLFEDELHDNGSSDLLVRIVGVQLISYRICVLTEGTQAGHAEMHLYPGPTNNSSR